MQKIKYKRMKKSSEHKLVNWVDGMEVSQKHQIQTEDFFINAICDSFATRLNNYNYGLLPAKNKNNPSGDFEISEQITDRVEIRLRRCFAITSGGYRINYDPEENDYIIHAFSMDIDPEKNVTNKENKTWDVVLGVNPFNRLPTGEPDADETPPRHPDVKPTYKLSVIPTGTLDPERFGMFYLTIGRIRYRGERLEVDDDYIPPCIMMSSHPDLLEYYEKFSNGMNRIELASRNIIAKVQNQQKTSTIAVNINAICQDLMRYMSIMYFMYRNAGKSMEPIRIIDYYSSLAHTCLASFSFINKHEKEELLKYFYDWNDIAPGAFEDILSEVSSIIYNHNNIREAMLSVEHFLNVFSELWSQLSTLEYIGQVKDNIVVTVKKSNTETTTTWSVID
jgi:hypothetical protein